jgi:hypothetical protein
MKFFILTTLALFLFVGTPSRAVTFGVEGGVNFNNATDFNLTNAAGGYPAVKYFIGGVYADIDLLGSLSFRPDLLISTSQPNYLVLPLMIIYKIDLGIVRPFIFAGPEIGYNINPFYFLQNWNLAADIGVGVETELIPQIVLGVNVRYAIGLTNEFNSQAQTTFAMPGGAAVGEYSRDVYLMASLGYRWE